MYGYSLKEFTSVPINTIMVNYGITLSPSTAQSILIGILPFGSVFGACFTTILINKCRRLSGIYIFAFVNVGAIVLVNITTFMTLIAGRFIEGICVGFYSAIAPIYLREIAPKEMRRMMGLFFSFGKILGVLFVISLELIFGAINLDIGWRIILSMTAAFSILQAVLIFFFGSDTPTELIEKGRHEDARVVIQKFYKEKYV
jgi:SP family galactose:H+ symporter-like MFS transporter